MSPPFQIIRDQANQMPAAGSALYSEDLERGILCAALSTAGAFDKIETFICAADFFDPANSELFGAFAIIKAADAIDPEMGRLLTFLLYTGCRIGEALALKWEQVSLDDRLAYIETSKNDDPRTVKLTEELCDLLAPHKKTAGKVFRFHQGGHRNFLFLNAKVTACGLPAIKRPRRRQRMVIPPYRYSWVTFHTFCHTWATWMRRFGGADLQALVATGRWRDERSAKRYTHTAAHEEWDRVDSLPSIGKSVETTLRKAKAQ